MSHKNHYNQAFSLLELAIVMVIIGLLIVGIAGSQRFIGKAKLSRARIITGGSPVPGIDGLKIWLESTTEDSLELNPDDTVETWYDRSVNGFNAINEYVTYYTRNGGANNLIAVGDIEGDGGVSLKVEKDFKWNQALYGKQFSIFLVVTTPADASTGGLGEQDIITGMSASEMRIGFDTSDGRFYVYENGHSCGGKAYGVYNFGESYVIQVFSPPFLSCCNNKITELYINSSFAEEIVFGGSISELIVYEGVIMTYKGILTDEEKTEVTSYLQKKYNITTDPVLLIHAGGC